MGRHDLHRVALAMITYTVCRRIEKDVEKILQSGIVAERIQSDSELLTLLLTAGEATSDLVRRLVTLGVDIEEIVSEKQSLEKEFMTLFR